MRIAKHMQILGATALAFVALSNVGMGQDWSNTLQTPTSDGPIWRTGKVGMGNGSAAPVAQLDLYGDMALNGNPLKLRGAIDNSQSHFIQYQPTYLGRPEVDFWSYTGNLMFVQAGQPVARMTVTGPGNVGIGTNNPVQRLQLANGNIMLPNGGASQDGNLYFGGTPETGQNGMRIYAGMVNGTIPGAFFDLRTSDPTDGYRFRVNGLDGTTERMRINARGQVGIGTSTPLELLQLGDRMTFQTGQATKAISYNSYFDAGVDKRIQTDFASSLGFNNTGDITFRTSGSNFATTNITWATPVIIKNNGRVGIGTTTPTYILDVAGDTSAGNFIATQRAINAYANGAASSTSKIGVYGAANGGGTGTVYGLYGSATSYGNGPVIGVYGVANGLNPSGQNAAVFAAGDVKYTGSSSQASDAKLKSNVKDMEGALSKIQQLSAKTYTFKTSEYSSLHLSSGTQFGFIAQDVEKIFPELVSTTAVPAPESADGNSTAAPITFKGLNYVGIIPVVAQAVKEQSEIVDGHYAELTKVKSELTDVKTQVDGVVSQTTDMKKQLDITVAENADLKNKVGTLTSENVDMKKQLSDILAEIDHLKNIIRDSLQSHTSGAPSNPTNVVAASLGHNSPNPFNEETTVTFELPQSVKMAQLVINDVNGAEVQRITLNDRGATSVVVSVKGMRAGTYVYSLLADGALVGTDKMIVVK